MKIGLSVFEKTCQEKKDDNRGKETAVTRRSSVGHGRPSLT